MWLRELKGLTIIFVVLATLDLVCCVVGENVLNTVIGQVGAGNYSYFMLKYEGPVELILTSFKGDADIYVSESIEHPTFDYHHHSMSSWSCGVDKIEVPKSIPRPIHIAVYGHPRYEVSKFKLEAKTLKEEFDPFVEVIDPHQVETNQQPKVFDETLTLGSILLTIIQSLIEILIEILL